MKNNGGSAFPAFDTIIEEVIGSNIKTFELGAPHGGMTLRDYFAAKVMQGMHSRDSYDSGQATPEQRAKLAYIDADAMLAERVK